MPPTRGLFLRAASTEAARGKGGGTLATVFGFDELAQARASLCHVIEAIDQFLARVLLVVS
jgi:hypothetical protein